MNKDELREEYKKLRKNERNEEKDEKIQKALLSLEEYMNSNLILSYVSTEKEVSTHEIIEKGIEKGKRIGVPKTLEEGLEFYEIDSLEELEPGYAGILEPKGNSKIEVSEADLMIVPGVVFDKEGYRIGYGGGYYDRVLKEYRKTEGKSVGLAYDFQIIDEIPREKHDIPVDKIITDERTISLK